MIEHPTLGNKVKLNHRTMNRSSFTMDVASSDQPVQNLLYSYEELPMTGTVELLSLRNDPVGTRDQCPIDPLKRSAPSPKTYYAPTDEPQGQFMWDLWVGQPIEGYHGLAGAKRGRTVRLGSKVMLGAEGDLSYLAIRLLRKDGSPQPGIRVESWAVGPVYFEESDIDGIVIFSYDGISPGTPAHVTIFDPSCGPNGCGGDTPMTRATATEAFEKINEYVSEGDYKAIVPTPDPRPSETSGGEVSGEIPSGVLIGGAAILVLAAVLLG